MYKKTLLSVLLTAVFATCVAQPESREYTLLRRLEQRRTTAGVRFHKNLSAVNDWICVAVPAGIAVTGWINGNTITRKKALFITESILVSSAITWSTKKIINRKRPAENNPSFTAALHLTGASFPSGHTSIAFSTATALTLSYPKWYIWIPAYSYAVFAGYSRLYLGVHYPTDVLAGAITGSGSALLTKKLNDWLFCKKDKKKSASW